MIQQQKTEQKGRQIQLQQQQITGSATGETHLDSYTEIKYFLVYIIC